MLVSLFLFSALLGGEAKSFHQSRQKILWILTIVVLNWIGLLLYYYTYYIKKN
ncbi:MAG: PLDc N-terminal domain-containing protein [Parabacteroides merdae]